MADVDTVSNQDYISSRSDARLIEASKRAERIIAEAEIQARKRGQEILAETVEGLRAQVVEEINRKAFADARKIVAEAEEKARKIVEQSRKKAEADSEVILQQTRD